MVIQHQNQFRKKWLSTFASVFAYSKYVFSVQFDMFI